MTFKPLNLRSAMILATLVVVTPLFAIENVTVTPDVVYGHKHGMALTLDVFQPKNANGVGVLFMVSGGWYSGWAPPEQTINLFRPLVDKGFTVFAVRHGSSPKYVIPEIVPDVQRSVRFVRLHAKEFHVDPNRLGVSGGSAGGHLSLMLGTTWDDGNPASQDDVLRTGNRVAAVVAYYPPTDLRPYVKKGNPRREQFPALQFDPNQADSVSPLLHITPKAPPTLMIHGDQDDLVPLWHSEKMRDALRAQGVDSDLLIIKGAGHGFGGQDAQRASEAWIAWFEKYLVKQ